jgi:ABC-type branched-subunit amino acid transport system ATPase component
MPEVQEKRQQAEKLSAPRWWMVYMATLLYLAFIILLLDWLTRHFRPS